MKPIVQITLLSVMLMLASLGRLFGQSQDLAKATIVSISTLTASSDLQFDTKSNHKDPYTSDEQRVRDTYQLNDKDWYSVTFEQVEAQSKCQLALHQDWIKEKGYQLNDTVHMNLLEQGISGPFHITDIKHILPQKVPDEDIADGYAYRPVTGLFTHVSDKVLMVHFESGDSLGITENHPVYSASAGGWKHAFELEKDEVVLSYFGQSKVSKITKLQGTHHVYNLEVKDLHNFLVGSDGVVVHNSGLCDFMIHIKKGNIEIVGGVPGAYKFKVGGIHHKSALDGTTARIKPGEVISKNSKGYYKAKVQMHSDKNPNNGGWVNKDNPCTFFPDEWSDDKIREEIAEAMANKISKGGNKFEGTMSDGTKLTMYINNGNIDSAFPNID